MAVLPVDPFIWVSGLDVPQPETTQRLDALSDRLMFRAQYRNFGTYQTLVVNHTVYVSSSGPTGIRWYELRIRGQVDQYISRGHMLPMIVCGDGWGVLL